MGSSIERITLPGTNPQPGTAAGSRSSSRLDVVGWIRNTVAAVFMIEHRGSVTCFKDLVRLSSQERPDPSAQPKAFFFDRAERLLPVAEPTLDELLAFTPDCLPVSAFLFRKNLRSFDARQMFPDA